MLPGDRRRIREKGPPDGRFFAVSRRRSAGSHEIILAFLYKAALGAVLAAS